MSSMPSDFGNEEYDLLSKISRHAWGHPELFLKNGTFPDIGDIEYVDLSKYLPAVDICSSGPELSLVLVRDEYRLALQALQRPTYARGAYVTGQPGIGKYRIMPGLSLGLNSTLQGKHFSLSISSCTFSARKLLLQYNSPKNPHATPSSPTKASPFSLNVNMARWSAIRAKCGLSVAPMR